MELGSTWSTCRRLHEGPRRGARYIASVINYVTLAVVGLGAALGGMLRFLVSQYVVWRWGMACAPWATVGINLSGSLLIGIGLEAFTQTQSLGSLWRPALVTGVLGGYTTFSTFSFEAVMLAERGQTKLALLYLGGSMIGGLLCAWLGSVLVRSFFAARG